MEKVSLLWIIVAALQLIGFLLSLIGYGADYIVSASAGSEYGHLGLWSVCFYKTSCLSPLEVFTSTAWIDASRGMMSIAIISQFVTIIITLLALLRPVTKVIALVTAGAAVFSVVNGIIGLAVAAGQGISNMEDRTKATFHVDWCFTLFIIGQSAFLLAAIWHFLTSRNKT